jgi:predicted nucleic acid-binding protein
VVLVDTSVWIDHLRRGSSQLAEALESGDVVCHALVIGELACGSLRERQTVLDLLAALPQATHAREDDVLSFIQAERLHGQGLGLIDVHLLWAARHDAHTLWTHDRSLRRTAARLGVAGK